ncbi:MAG: MAPEG family protein [Cognatishimia sp.]
MEIFAPYASALISLLIFTLVVLLQSALVGAGKAKAGLTPGSEPSADYDSPIYRLNRSHQNGVEIMPAAAIALFTSVFLGVSPGWVNMLMAIFLLTRIIYIAIYARNVGKPTQGVRTIVFVLGWATLVALCLMSLWALI